jgi:hypothetical protein
MTVVTGADEGLGHGLRPSRWLTGLAAMVAGELLSGWVVGHMHKAEVAGALILVAGHVTPLRASLPAITAAEPLSGMVLGVVVFRASVHVSPRDHRARVLWAAGPPHRRHHGRPGPGAGAAAQPAPVAPRHPPPPSASGGGPAPGWRPETVPVTAVGPLGIENFHSPGGRDGMGRAPVRFFP